MSENKEKSPEEIKAEETAQLEKIKKLHVALGLPAMIEDSKAIREDMNSLSTNFNKLCEALNSAQNTNQQSQTTTNQDDVSPEQKMLLLKDGIAGVADLVKAWRGNVMPPQMQQQNDFQSMIMQSFAKMIQAKVDETIFSTYGTQIPVDQINTVRQIQSQVANISQQRPSFEK